jgi:hypothetical protein
VKALASLEIELRLESKGTAMTEGSCLCGAVRYTVAAPFGAATACHCSQCRRQSGHFWACADVPKAAIALTGADALRWYRASPDVRRGFCGTCGSFLFWDPDGKGNDRARPRHHRQRHRPRAPLSSKSIRSSPA